MSPETMGGLQGLTVQQLNNIITQISEMQTSSPIVINGNFLGMQTRFGHIQFPMDMFIAWRDTPVQAYILPDGTNQATATGPTPPASVTPAVAADTTGASEFSGSYVPGGNGGYVYAVASTDSSGSMIESQLTYSSVVTGVAAGNKVTLTIAPPSSHDAGAFRVFRSGQGYSLSSGQAAYQFRYIGAVAASGSNNVTFVDYNNHIPGSSSIFLLDLDTNDLAIDYRILLPLARIELFAQNLFMPWAVGSISSVRVRIPKFHGMIRNFVPTNPVWSPFATNI